MRLAALLLLAGPLSAPVSFERLDPGFRVEAEDGIPTAHFTSQPRTAPGRIRQPEFIACIDVSAARFGEFAERAPREVQGPLRREGGRAALRNVQKLFGRP